MPSRRDLLVGIAGGLSLSAGCLGTDETIARCSGGSEGNGNQHLQSVAPITGEEEVALGILVSEAAVSDQRFDAINVRNVDGDLMARIPIEANRGMSDLDPENYPVLSSGEGELYAVPLDEPPVHGEMIVSLVNSENEQISTTQLRFNCYAEDGGIP